MTDQALFLIAVAGVCGLPVITAVIALSLIWLFRRLGYRVR